MVNRQVVTLKTLGHSVNKREGPSKQTTDNLSTGEDGTRGRLGHHEIVVETTLEALIPKRGTPWSSHDHKSDSPLSCLGSQPVRAPPTPS